MVDNLAGFLELIPMRDDERVDPEKVGACLEGRLPGARGTPEVLQFEGGKANLTYLLRYPAGSAGAEGAGAEYEESGAVREYVLRRPPLGPVAPKSHDMGREYKVLSKLNAAYPLAPQAYYYSEDTDVVGAPFLVMERRRGIVIRQELPERFQGRPELNRRLGEMIVDGLADLHAVDPQVSSQPLNMIGPIRYARWERRVCCHTKARYSKSPERSRGTRSLYDPPISAMCWMWCSVLIPSRKST